MNIIRLIPDTIDSKNSALKTADNKIADPPPYGNIISDPTSARVISIYSKYSAARKTWIEAEAAAASATIVKNEALSKLKAKDSHYIQELNILIRDGVLKVDFRKYYKIPINDPRVPSLTSEEKVLTVSQNIIDGEPAMILAGGKAIPYPLLKDISDGQAMYIAKKKLQSDALIISRDAKKALKLLFPEADAVIKKVWDEVETYFNELPKESMRIEARVWGVVYVTTGKPIVITANVGQLINDKPVPVVGAKCMLIETDEWALTVVEGGLTLKTKGTGKLTLRITMDKLKTVERIIEIIPGTDIKLGIIWMEPE